MGAQWLSGRALDSRTRGRGFEPHRRHCIVSLSKNINPSLVLVQPRKTRPFITERLLMGRKESNQTKTKQTLKSRLSSANSFFFLMDFHYLNTIFFVIHSFIARVFRFEKFQLILKSIVIATVILFGILGSYLFLHIWENIS